MSLKIINKFDDSTTRSLTSADSGSLNFIDTTSANIVVNLPPPRAGLYYEFVVSNSSTTAYTFTLKSVNASYVHTALMYVGKLSNTISKTITIDSSLITNLSDRLIINCDGTNWFVTITASNTDSYTLTS